MAHSHEILTLFSKRCRMDSNRDRGVKKYFQKVLNSLFMGLLWMIACVTAGIYFGYAYTAGKPLIYTILFYVGMAGSLGGLLYYYYRTWKK